MTEQSELPRFVGMVLVLLIPSFVLWMLISPWLAGPAVWVCDALFTLWMPEVVDSVQLRGTQALVMTLYGELDGAVVTAAQAGSQMGFPVDVRLLSYSIPFYAALHFSTPQSGGFSSFGWGLWVLYPLIILGLVCVCLKNLMMGLGVPFFAQSAAFVPSGHAIGLVYQLSILIVPPLAPILLWAWQARETPLLKQFSRTSSTGPKIPE
ncbi:MAG: exosortase H-associated membrane protein [Halioglobus sp.]